MDFQPASLGERIDYIKRQQGAGNFSKASGVSSTQINRYIRGESQPTIEPLIALAQAGGVSLEWLATGNGSMEGGAPADALAGYAAISPLADQPEAAGLDAVLLPEAQLAQRGIDAGQCALVVATDDAMAPALAEGDQVVIALGAARRDGIYAVRVQGAVVLRRLQFAPDGSLQLRCDNGAYQNYVLDAEQQKAIELIGRRVWSGSF